MASDPTISYLQESDGLLKRTLVDWVEVASGRDQLTRIYDELRKEPFEITRFFTRAVELGKLRLSRNSTAESLIPPSGPLVLLANHPFGIVDGLVLCELAARLRGDFRIMLNNRLMKDDNLNALFLPVDFDGTRAAMRTRRLIQPHQWPEWGSMRWESSDPAFLRQLG